MTTLTTTTYGRYSMFNQPEIGQRRINIFGSLTKATDFDCEYLYIDFEFDVPSSKYSVINNSKKKQNNLKYSTNCSYYMRLNNKKTYNFSSIFELEIIETLSEKNNFNTTPRIYFEVNSVDYWDRHRIEGYGLLNIDLDKNNNNNNNNDKEIRVPIWRPIGSIREEMQRFFIGGGKRLKDKKSISIPTTATTNSFNARSNWNTLETGNIYINMNIISTYNQTYTKQKRHIHNDIKSVSKLLKNTTKHKRRKTKLSKLITLTKDVSDTDIVEPTKQHKRRKTKLSKLITLKQDIKDIKNIEKTDDIKPRRSTHHKRKKSSKLLQKMNLSD